MSSKRRGNRSSEKEIRNLINSKTFKEKVQKGQKEALSTTDLESMLQNVKNFLGVFPCDRIKFIKCSFTIPKFMIVNLDSSLSEGSHWLALRIDSKSVEIFDSLGYNPRIWKILPVPLLQFLNKLLKTRKKIITPILQTKYDTLCGLFCVYFILFRKIKTFPQCLSVFNRSLELNKKILINHLS